MKCHFNQSIPFESRKECSLEPPEIEGSLDAVAGVRLVVTFLGIIGSSSIICLTLLKKRAFSPEVHPIFMLSVADCFLGMMWVTGGGLWLAPAQSYDNRWCYTVSLITVMLECVTINLVLVYAIFAYIGTRRIDLNSLITHTNKRFGLKIAAIVYSIAWFLPVALVLLIFLSINGADDIVSNVNSCTCWCVPTIINVIPLARRISSNDTALSTFLKQQHNLIYALGSLIITNYVAVFIGLVVLYFQVLRRIKLIRQEHDEVVFGRVPVSKKYGTAEYSRLQHGQAKARKRVVIFLTIFLFSGFWNIVVTALLIGFLDNPPHRKEMSPQHSTVHPIRFRVFVSILVIKSILIGLQGFVNAIAYGWTREDFIQTLSLPLTSEEPTYDRDNNPASDDINDSGEMLKNELEYHKAADDDKNSLLDTLYNSSYDAYSD